MKRSYMELVARIHETWFECIDLGVAKKASFGDECITLETYGVDINHLVYAYASYILGELCEYAESQGLSADIRNTTTRFRHNCKVKIYNPI